MGLGLTGGRWGWDVGLRMRFGIGIGLLDVGLGCEI